MFRESNGVIPTSSCHASLDKAACAPFCKGKAHEEARQRHQVSQEIRWSVVEGPAVEKPNKRLSRQK